MEKFKELSFEELREVDGGNFWLWTAAKWAAGAIAASAAVEVITEGWDSVVSDFNEGYNEVRN
jgi:lactobin A/cerein 7B family class IIb bacteriocin